MSFTIDLPWRATARLAVTLAFGLLPIAGRAHAQQVSKAQLDAIKASCRSGYIANCMGVTPGGKEALQCLQSHVAKLSGECKTAVSATMAPPKAAPAPKAAEAPKPAPKPAEAPKPAPAPKPAAAAAPPPSATPPRGSAAKSAALNRACGNDYLAYCASVPPGGKEAVACLKQHAMELSVPCKRVLSAMMTPAPNPVVHAAPPPPAMPPPAAAMPMPTPKQLHALKFTCRRDFRTQCRGVPPGGQAAFACLVRHQRRLSPNCTTSVRAIVQSVPAAAAPPPAVPVARIESMSLRERLRIARACDRDRMMVCPRVEPGGGRLIMCLASHPTALSPRCGRALRRALY